MMKIHIEDLEFKAIIGILDFERKSSQNVIINLTLDYKYDDDFINYVDIVHCIKTQMQEKKFLLLEDALSEISKTLKNKFHKINSLNIKITKPSIMTDCKVSLSEKYNFDS